MTIDPVYVNDVVPDMRDSEVKNEKRVGPPGRLSQSR
jgi:hypothetical protein